MQTWHRHLHTFLFLPAKSLKIGTQCSFLVFIGFPVFQKIIFYYLWAWIFLFALVSDVCVALLDPRWLWVLKDLTCNRPSVKQTDRQRSCTQHNVITWTWLFFSPRVSLSILLHLSCSPAVFKETVGGSDSRLAHWLCHLYFLSNDQFLPSECYNPNEAKIETSTFDLILHRSITVRWAPGFYVPRVT